MIGSYSYIAYLYKMEYVPKITVRNDGEKFASFHSFGKFKKIRQKTEKVLVNSTDSIISLIINNHCDNYVLKWWVELVVHQHFLSYLQKITKSFSKFLFFSILLTFIYLVAPNLLVDNQLNSSSSSSLRHIIVTQLLLLMWNCRIRLLSNFKPKNFATHYLNI